MNTSSFIKRVVKHWPVIRKDIPDSEETRELITRIKSLLVKRNAVIVAHYYTDPLIQQLAEETGGFIGDSLEMARFGAEHAAKTLLVAGVRFMGESAKILSPNKRILIPDLHAECSLDLGCQPEEFKEFCETHPDRVVVVYANTSAEIKSMADWAVTSSIALDVVRHLANDGDKVIWAPDINLGRYIQEKTGADMLLWDAFCVVHAEFDDVGIAALKESYPDAKVLVHPEANARVVEMADVVGSTSQLLSASIKHSAKRFIVATESGILYKMKQAMPDKEFFMAPTKAFNHEKRCSGECPWMRMINLHNIHETLKHEKNEIHLAPEIIRKALVPLTRMLEFRKKN